MTDLELIAASLVLSILVAVGAYFSGRAVGRQSALRDVAELAGKEQQALRKRIDETPKPDVKSALDQA